jgi:Raf kinase inhibitor-like YbhB/YbcL family protein
MRQVLLSILPIALVASCSAGDRASHQTQRGNSVDRTTLAKLELTSPAFADGQQIPTQYSCDGAGQSPPLAWGDPPRNTKSFAMVIDDPDAPSGTFRHWGVYDIPPGQRDLAAGAGAPTRSSLMQSLNDGGKPGYTGMCPPKGHGLHLYHFRLFALDVSALDLPAAAKVKDIEDAALKHAIGQGELVGTYERK